MPSASLAGQSIAVTGGGNGIGRAIATQFVRAGARVTIGDLDIDAANELVQMLGDAADAVELDVSDPDAFRGFLDAAEQRHGPLDVMVNNAGVDWMSPFHEEPDGVTRRQVDVNVLGTIYGTRTALQRMLARRRGHIVNVASGAGRVPLPGSSSYSATKHAIVGLTESLRLEYRGSGVRFSLIQPSQVDTAMIEGQPRPRLLPVVTPDDVATAVLAAVRDDRFEVWVPASQGVSAKFSALLPRRAREAAFRALGVVRIGGDADLIARRGYHERMFGTTGPDHRSGTTTDDGAAAVPPNGGSAD
jgi:NAD(P)-dependent dehydrogenase (short-subunit alcohol dehydrogenase family)